MIDLADDDAVVCVGSVHVPGHTPGCPLAVAPATGIVHRWEPDTLPTAGLSLELTVNVVRVGRRRCPRCRRVRVLSRLTAFSNNQPVGYGVSRCGECAGLRKGTVDGDA